MTDEELYRRVYDKSDYRKRLDLIALLRPQRDERSSAALTTLAQNDFVYQVRLAAWQALTERGVALKEPLQRPRYVVWLERAIDRTRRVFNTLADFWTGWGW